MKNDKGKYKVVYKTLFGHERTECFDIEFWCDELIRELNKPHQFVQYVRKEVKQ